MAVTSLMIVILAMSILMVLVNWVVMNIIFIIIGRSAVPPRRCRRASSGADGSPPPGSPTAGFLAWQRETSALRRRQCTAADPRAGL